jgi:predicted HAD superfamily Cof-like phosphohydrolase
MQPSNHPHTPFDDVKYFMDAAGHKPGKNAAFLYWALVREEFKETVDAVTHLNEGRFQEPVAAYSDVVDGLGDLIWVAAGMLHALGVDPNKIWEEIRRANVGKIDERTGSLVRRPDGKVLKPEGWVGPDHRLQCAEAIKKGFARGDSFQPGDGWRTEAQRLSDE